MISPSDSQHLDFAIPRALFRNRLILLIIAAHLAVGITIGTILNLSFWESTAPTILGRVRVLLMFMAANFLLWRFFVALIKVKPARPLRWMLNDIRYWLGDADRTLDVVINIICALSLMTTYGYLKDQIPLLNPYSWDPFLTQLDRTLHGGHDVWQWLWPILKAPLVTTVINAFYHGWILVIYMALSIACLDRRDATRSTVFMVAFALCWSVGGNLLATLFASVGPVFHQPFGFGDTFVPQLELLQSSDQVSPVWALHWHQLLLDGHFNDGPISGISAMPSMHVASSALVTLFAFRYSKGWGIALSLFTVVIILGSVHLAWHYAVDAYASLLLAALLWWVSQKLVARFGPNA